MTSNMKVVNHEVGKLLLICNAYPSNADLYRNGFIHRRVKEYQALGTEVEVFYNHQPVTNKYTYLFDGVSVTVGNDEALFRTVTESEYAAYLVHFAEPSRIEPLIRAKIRQPVIVWIHGFEAEAWHRRWFNFVDSKDSILEALAKKEHYYSSQNEFLGDLIRERPLNLTFVNISNWFRSMVVEPDLGVEFVDDYVIPNLIDENIFPYREKKKNDRFNLLSIRPFASYKYANDITVEAIQILSNRPFFPRLHFTLVGDGRFFSEITNPLRAFKNVQLNKKFIKQTDISKLHEANGVFISPTRFDSQGVSMCEAMSSGLVPVSTDISAIPEFVQHGESGLLVPPESPRALADAIEELYFDPELYARLSISAAKNVRQLCGRRATTDRELSLIKQRVECSG